MLPRECDTPRSGTCAEKKIASAPAIDFRFPRWSANGTGAPRGAPFQRALFRRCWQEAYVFRRCLLTSRFISNMETCLDRRRSDGGSHLR